MVLYLPQKQLSSTEMKRKEHMVKGMENDGTKLPEGKGKRKGLFQAAFNGERGTCICIGVTIKSPCHSHCPIILLSLCHTLFRYFCEWLHRIFWVVFIVGQTR